MPFILFSKPQTTLRVISKDGSTKVTNEYYATLISTIAALLAIIGSIVLVSTAMQHQNYRAALSFLIYGICLSNLFIMSALHHGIDSTPENEHFLLQLDYYSIYAMIAGTFTPLCMILLPNQLGMRVLAIIWLVGVGGIALKAKFPHMPKWISTSFYIAMGWMTLIIVKPIYFTAPQSIPLISLGGGLFTGGALIFYFEKPNPIAGKFGFHEIWHLFVVAGAACHFFVMYFYLLPR